MFRSRRKLPSFETPRFARLLRMRSERILEPHPEERPKGASRRMAACVLALAFLAMSRPSSCAAEAELVEQGRDLYGDFCATCHGRDMVNTGTFSFDLRRFPKDDFPRFRNSVLEGKNQAMPAWRDKITDEDLAALWAYVRSGA
jgi:mono/diheme cytochrome c family protein